MNHRRLLSRQLLAFVLPLASGCGKPGPAPQSVPGAPSAPAGVPASGAAIPEGAGPQAGPESAPWKTSAGVVPPAEAAAIRKQAEQLAAQSARGLDEWRLSRDAAEEEKTQQAELATSFRGRAQQLRLEGDATEADRLEEEAAAAEKRRDAVVLPAAPDHTVQDKAFEAMLFQFRSQVKAKRREEAGKTLAAMRAALPMVSPSMLEVFKTDMAILEVRGGQY